MLGLGGELRQAQRRCAVCPSFRLRRRVVVGEALVQRMGLTVVQGNRMGRLLGPDISKGKALATLTSSGCRACEGLGLGDSPNDLPLLGCPTSLSLCRGRWPPSRLRSVLLQGDSSWRKLPMPEAGMRLCAGFCGSRRLVAPCSAEQDCHSSTAAIVVAMGWPLWDAIARQLRLLIRGLIIWLEVAQQLGFHRQALGQCTTHDPGRQPLLRAGVSHCPRRRISRLAAVPQHRAPAVFRSRASSAPCSWASLRAWMACP